MNSGECQTQIGERGGEAQTGEASEYPSVRVGDQKNLPSSLLRTND